MQFKDVIGQQEVKQRLVGSVDRGRISHAQLFTGDEGVGALPLAIAYAQYLNCPHRHDGDSCGVCPSCHQIGQLATPTSISFFRSIRLKEKVRPRSR